MKYKLSIFVMIFPLIIGGSIYLFWRPDSLLMFVWIDYLGLTDILMWIRGSLINYKLPDWILYNLPNGVWTYSFTALLVYLWVESTSWKKYLYMLTPLTLGFSFELGQYFNIIPGTFCIGDILAHLTGAFIGYVLIIKLKKREDE